VKNLSIIVVLSILLTVFGYVFVSMHLDVPDKVRRERNQKLGGSSSTAERIHAVGRLNVAAAEDKSESVKIAAAVAAPPAAVDGQKVYNSACGVCHGAGIAGAPKLGDTGLWSKRIAKGTDSLYANAIKGFQGSTGTMPAKGGNAALTDAEVKAAVDFMVAKSK
jgi:cytochrome c5